MLNICREHLDQSDVAIRLKGIRPILGNPFRKSITLCEFEIFDTTRKLPGKPCGLQKPQFSRVSIRTAVFC
jgi:hypothetical protein